MHGKLKGNTGVTLGFQVDKSFYSFKDLVEKTSHPVKLQFQKLLLPKEVVEAIFIYLVDNEVSYRFSGTSLYFSVYGNFKVNPEPIDLHTIIIDPGHGGHQLGAPSVYGDDEKVYTLEVAKILQKYLKKKFPNLRIIFTRDEDIFVDLNERAKIANEELKVTKSILFVSLHCNSVEVKSETAKGYEIYYLDQTKKLEQERQRTIVTRRLVDLEKPPVIQKIQTDMLSSVIQRRSILLAKSVEEKLNETIGSRIVSRGVKRANFRVLRGSIMPAILVEMGFISHPEDARLIADKNMQIKIVKGIVEGIKEYVQSKD